MDIMYFGNACSEKFEEEILKLTNASFAVAQNNLERALLDGFAKNGIKSITANCVPSLNYQILGNKLFFKRKIDKINEYNIYTKTFTVIKLPLVKYLIYFFITIHRLIKWYHHSNDNDKIVFVSVNFIPVTLAIKILSHILKFKTICLLCDLSKDMYTKERIKDMPYLKRLIMPLYNKIIKYVESNYDFYVFISKDMNVININNRPFVIIEGIYNDNLKWDKEIHENKSKKDKKILLYSGSLYRIYGIEKILEVFESIDEAEYELHIYGDGECKNDVLEAQKRNKNIHYHGFISREELFIKLQEATLLVNLRNPDYDFTKYSFPSKYLEYMASGTPTLSTKLDGIPEEYFNCLYLVDNYDNLAIKNKIIETCKLDNNEINFIGERARALIINEKTSKKQVEKIINLLIDN